MRALLVVMLLGLAGCEAAVAPLLGAELASVIVFQRSLVDAAYSTVSGRDCSIVRLDQGRSWCREAEGPPAPPPFCTRSLAGVDCWTNPQALVGGTRQVADGPRSLTASQEADRTRRWPQF